MLYTECLIMPSVPRGEMHLTRSLCNILKAAIFRKHVQLECKTNREVNGEPRVDANSRHRRVQAT